MLSKALFTPLFFATLVLVFVNASLPQHSTETRSTKAEGQLFCGKVPLNNSIIRLFRAESDDLEDVLATATTNSNGQFLLQGDTSTFKAEKAGIDPYLKIYHKCGMAAGKSGYKRVTLRYPREFVALGQYPRNSYKIGTLNLQFQYPAEVHVDKIEGVKR